MIVEIQVEPIVAIQIVSLVSDPKHPLAALQAPVILMAQNRQSDKDRAVAKNDFQVNLKSELEIADLHRKMDSLVEVINTQKWSMY